MPTPIEQWLASARPLQEFVDRIARGCQEDPPQSGASSTAGTYSPPTDESKSNASESEQVKLDNEMWAKIQSEAKESVMADFLMVMAEEFVRKRRALEKLISDESIYQCRPDNFKQRREACEEMDDPSWSLDKLAPLDLFELFQFHGRDLGFGQLIFRRVTEARHKEVLNSNFDTILNSNDSLSIAMQFNKAIKVAMKNHIIVLRATKDAYEEMSFRRCLSTVLRTLRLRNAVGQKADQIVAVFGCIGLHEGEVRRKPFISEMDQPIVAKFVTRSMRRRETERSIEIREFGLCTRGLYKKIKKETTTGEERVFFEYIPEGQQDEDGETLDKILTGGEHIYTHVYLALPRSLLLMADRVVGKQEERKRYEEPHFRVPLSTRSCVPLSDYSIAFKNIRSARRNATLVMDAKNGIVRTFKRFVLQIPSEISETFKELLFLR